VTLFLRTNLELSVVFCRIVIIKKIKGVFMKKLLILASFSLFMFHTIIESSFRRTLPLMYVAKTTPAEYCNRIHQEAQNLIVSGKDGCRAAFLLKQSQAFNKFKNDPNFSKLEDAVIQGNAKFVAKFLDDRQKDLIKKA
jgi:hypothetical protein